MKFRQLRSQFFISIVFGAAAVGGLLVYGDVRGIGGSLADFKWEYLPAILGLTLFNYAMRFVKWQYYLRISDIRGLPFVDSLLIFLSGLAMAMTPAKVGEWIKSYFLYVERGVAISRSAPIVLAERLSDGYAMILLSIGGLLLFKQGWVFIVVLAFIGLGFAAAFRFRPFATWSVSLAQRVPVARRYSGFIQGFYENAFLLFSPRALALPVAMGLLSWAGEGVALYFVFRGLGAENSGELVVMGIFVLSTTTMAGAALLVPGGLGVAEGGITGLGQSLVGLTREAAATSALIIRLCTLWFGVAIGLAALVVLTRRLSGDGLPEPGEASPAT